MLAETPSRSATAFPLCSSARIRHSERRRGSGILQMASVPSATTPVELADAGVENVNAEVDDLITTAKKAAAFFRISRS